MQTGKTEFAYHFACEQDRISNYYRVILVYNIYQPAYDKFKSYFGDRLILCKDLSDQELHDIQSDVNFERPSLLLSDDHQHKVHPALIIVFICMCLLVDQR